VSDFLVRVFREKLRKAHEDMQDTVMTMNSLLRGQDVILKHGKYKDRRAQIQDYYFDHGRDYVHVFIYRTDKRIGFRGKEKFIDDHDREFLEFEQCELV